MQEIYTTEEWEDLLAQSEEVPVLFMKHSSTCPISKAAFNELRKVETHLPKKFLIVQTSRPLSNEIARDTDIRHESPQLFLLKQGRVVWKATHYTIQESAIRQAIHDYT